MAYLSVENLEKAFGGTRVLRDVSFQLPEGETLSVIGTSGSGKTTLLRCLNFLERPDGGVISLRGEPLLDASRPPDRERDLRRKRLHFGLVFQDFNLFDHLTAEENVSIALRKVMGCNKAEARNRAYAALKKHRKRSAQLDEQMERDNARMEELLAMMADPDFYVNEDASSDAIAEHAKLKQRLAAAEEEWFTLTEELEAEMARQQERA